MAKNSKINKYPKFYCGNFYGCDEEGNTNKQTGFPPMPESSVIISLVVPIKTHHHKFSRQEVENRTKNESNQRACKDYDVVGHAEVGRGQINEQGRSVNTSIKGQDRVGAKRSNYSRGQIPSTLCIRQMISVPQEHFRYVHRKPHLFLRRKVQRRLESRGSRMSNRRNVGDIRDNII